MAPQDVGNLLGMDEHAAHLCRLVGAAKPPLDPVVGPAARARAGQHRREITGGKADQRIFRCQRRYDDFADLPRSHRLPGPGKHQLEYDALIEHHALADIAVRAQALIRDDADIGGAVALQHAQPQTVEFRAQRPG